MNLYGILIAKDEEDIIEQTFLSLRDYGEFKKIFFYDNGSSDNTIKIAKKFNDSVDVNILNQNYSDRLKYELFYHHADEYEKGDWVVILDADELFIENSEPKILAAEENGSNCIEYEDVQFYFTEQDDFSIFHPNVPAVEQRPYYLINYGEPRIFKYDPKIKLTEQKVKSRFEGLKLSSEKLLVHHFQYRSAKQTQHRIDIRLANDRQSGNWGHIKDHRWQDYQVNSKWLHQFNGTHCYGLPPEANLFKIPNNPAYTGASLNWMANNGYLTEGQKKFFTTGKVERILRRFF